MPRGNLYKADDQQQQQHDDINAGAYRPGAIQDYTAAMKRLALIILLLLASAVADAGTVKFSWDAAGATCVYTVRLTRINISSCSCYPMLYQDYTTVATSIVVSDICQKFYPAVSDTANYGLIAKVGGYRKDGLKWTWLGWSRNAVLDLYADFGCGNPTTPPLYINLPYPISPAQ